MNEMTQAKKGGELGINGDFYQGGQFLPNSKDTVKGMNNGKNHAKKARKEQTAPYVYEICPEGHRSIFVMLSELIKRQWVTRDWSEDVWEVTDNDRYLMTRNIDIDKVQHWLDKWLNGEKWVKVNNNRFPSLS